MSGKTVNSAILLLVIGNAMAIISDVFIKLLEPGAPIFQFAFLRCVLTLFMLLPLIGKLEPEVPLRGPENPRHSRSHPSCWHAMHGRSPGQPAPGHGQCGVLCRSDTGDGSGGAGLRRTPHTYERNRSVQRVPAGIMLILRPVEFDWAAIAALGSAFTLAINAVMVRKLPRQQSTIHKLFLNYLLIVPAAAALALWEGASWDGSMLISASGSALFILGYNMTVLLAYQQVDANQVTSAEYTGLIWAVLIGWVGLAMRCPTSGSPWAVP